MLPPVPEVWPRLTGLRTLSCPSVGTTRGITALQSEFPGPVPFCRERTMTTKRPEKTHLNIAFIKEMLNTKKKKKSKRCHECQEHFCGINRAVTSYIQSSTSGLCRGPAGAPAPLSKDPVVNEIKETTHPVHIRRLPSPTLFPTMTKPLTPGQANRSLGQKKSYQIFIFKQTHTHKTKLKTARCNQAKVFIASPARAGRKGRVLLRGVRTGHFPGDQAFGAVGSLPCPPSPPAPRAWPTCGWRRAFAPSVFPHPKLAAASQVCALISLFLPLAARSRVRALSSYSQARGLPKSERARNRSLHPERQKSRETIDSDRFASPKSRTVRGRGRAGEVGRCGAAAAGAGGPVSRAPRPPPPPPSTVSGLSPGS